LTGTPRLGCLFSQTLDHCIACLSRSISEPFRRPHPGIGDQRRGRCLCRFYLLEASRRDLIPRDPHRALDFGQSLIEQDSVDGRGREKRIHAIEAYTRFSRDLGDEAVAFHHPPSIGRSGPSARRSGA